MKSTLVTHLKIHQNIVDREKLSCDKCEKSFYSSSTFKAHLKNHENPVPCDICSETFITTGALNEHKENFHKEFRNKKQTPYEYSDIKLAEPLIITNQGLLQNTPRYIFAYLYTIFEKKYIGIVNFCDLLGTIQCTVLQRQS